MSEESIVTDDLDNTTEEQHYEVEPVGLSPREEKLKALMDQYNESNGFVEAEPAENVEVVQAAAEPEPRPARTDSLYQSDDGTTVLKLKVNGQVIEKPLDQAIIELQKAESADERLRQAAAERKQLEEYANRLEIERQALELRRTQAVQESAPALSTDDAKAFVSELFDGDNDSAAEKLVNLMGRTQAPVNPDLIADIAAKKALQEMNEHTRQREFLNSVERGKQWLYDTYPDAIQDHDIASFIDYKTIEISKLDPTLSPEQVIKRATTDVLKKFNMVQSDAINDRTAQKQTLPKPVNRQSNSTRASAKPVEETPQDVYERMRADRASIRNHNY